MPLWKKQYSNLGKHKYPKLKTDKKTKKLAAKTLLKLNLESERSLSIFAISNCVHADPIGRMEVSDYKLNYLLLYLVRK